MLLNMNAAFSLQFTKAANVEFATEQAGSRQTQLYDKCFVVEENMHHMLLSTFLCSFHVA